MTNKKLSLPSWAKQAKDTNPLSCKDCSTCRIKDKCHISGKYKLSGEETRAELDKILDKFKSVFAKTLERKLKDYTIPGFTEAREVMFPHQKDAYTSFVKRSQGIPDPADKQLSDTGLDVSSITEETSPYWREYFNRWGSLPQSEIDKVKMSKQDFTFALPTYAEKPYPAWPKALDMMARDLANTKSEEETAQLESLIHDVLNHDNDSVNKILQTDYGLSGEDLKVSADQRRAWYQEFFGKVGYENPIESDIRQVGMSRVGPSGTLYGEIDEPNKLIIQTSDKTKADPENSSFPSLGAFISSHLVYTAGDVSEPAVCAGCEFQYSCPRVNKGDVVEGVVIKDSASIRHYGPTKGSGGKHTFDIETEEGKVSVDGKPPILLKSDKEIEKRMVDGYRRPTPTISYFDKPIEK